MNDGLRELARWIANSAANDVAVHWLRNVPGLPPIAQTLHLVSIAVILGSIVVFNLRVLRLIAPSQDPVEMSQRLAPWTWAALPVLFLSGSIFVLARPHRYFMNPIFGIKLAALVAACALAAIGYALARRGEVASLRARGVALVGLLAWIGTILAGRWIAYVDYLFPSD
ncbi:MAG TPA: DUF6644 family protein [Steroidobacteraceae bacterium]